MHANPLGWLILRLRDGSFNNYLINQVKKYFMVRMKVNLLKSIQNFINFTKNFLQFNKINLVILRLKLKKLF